MPLPHSSLRDIPPMSLCVCPWATLKAVEVGEARAEGGGGSRALTFWLVPEAPPPEASIIGLMQRRQSEQKGKTGLQRILSSIPGWSRRGGAEGRTQEVSTNAKSSKQRMPGRGAVMALTVAGWAVMAAVAAYATLRSGGGPTGAEL